MGNQLTLSLLNDATVSGDVHFYDVCKVADSVTIAYNTLWTWFELDFEWQAMEPFPVRPKKGEYTKIPRDWEIIKPFLDHYSLNATWVDCEFTQGVFDNNTGTWTGAVGKVKNC